MIRDKGQVMVVAAVVAIIIVAAATVVIAPRTVTVTVEGEGEVTFEGKAELNAFGSLTIGITPGEGMESRVYLDGELVATGCDSYRFSASLTDFNPHAIMVVFVPVYVQEHTIAATAGPGGSISPLGEVKVSEGRSQTFTVTPDDGYMVSHVLVDGKPVALTGGSYTFADVTADHTIDVAFEQIVLDSIAVSGDYRDVYLAGEAFDPEGMVVTATYSDGSAVAVTGYTVSPAGALTAGTSAVNVSYGGVSATVYVTVVDPASIDGIEIVAGPEKTHYFHDMEFVEDGIEVSAIIGDTTVPIGLDDCSVTEESGTVTVVYQGHSDTVSVVRDYAIHDVEELQYFAGKVNNGADDYAGETISLGADLNLRGVEWTPIGLNADASENFKGTFDGNGYVVSNLRYDTVGEEAAYSAAGFFGALNGTLKDLVFENAYISHLSAPGTSGATTNGVAVAVGSLYSTGSIEGVTVRDSEVSGNRYVSAIAGYVYGSVSGCTVEDVTLTATPDELSGSFDNGDKAGAIAGYWCSENVYTISGNTVSGITITGYRDLGLLVGAGDFDEESDVSGNTVNGVNRIVVDRTIICGSGDQASNAGMFVGRFVGEAKQCGSNTDTGELTIIDRVALRVSTPKDLMDLAADVNSGETYSGSTVLLTNDIDMIGYGWVPIGESVESYPSTAFSGTFEGDGYTISNLKSEASRASNSDTNAADGLFGTLCGKVRNLTLENVYITGTHYVGAVAGYSSANTATEIVNCHVIGAVLVTAPVEIGGSYDNGDKIGGIIGYMVDGDVVSGCTVSDADITGFRNIGGIAGYSAGEVTDCSIDGVRLYQSGRNAYLSSSIGDSVIGSIVGTQTSTFSGSGNTGEAEITCSFSINGVKQEGLNYFDESKSSIDIGDADGFLFVMSNYDGILGKLATKAATPSTVYLWSWTINLTGDIDLGGAEYAPFDYGYGPLKGNGHTISNAKIVADVDGPSKQGLFQSLGDVSNLTVRDVTIVSETGGAWIGTVAGFSNGDWSDVNVIVFSISADDSAYIGGLIGDSYASISDSTVSGGSISGGKNVGGFIGFIGAESGGIVSVEDCSVTDVTIDATKRPSTVGSFVGRLNSVGNSSITLSGCTVDNVTGGNVPNDRIYGDVPNEAVTVNGQQYGPSV